MLVIYYYYYFIYIKNKKKYSKSFFCKRLCTSWSSRFPNSSLKKYQRKQQ